MLCHEILFKNYLKLCLKLIYGSFFLKGVQYFKIGMFQNSFCLDKNLHCFQCSGITNDTVDSLACASLHRKNRYLQVEILGQMVCTLKHIRRYCQVTLQEG